jgi:hypothetical protein
MPQYLGITMDIPHGAREPLTWTEMLSTGFAYGVSSYLLPLVQAHSTIRSPPRTLDQIMTRIAGHRTKPVQFPAFFPQWTAQLPVHCPVGLM